MIIQTDIGAGENVSKGFCCSITKLCLILHNPMDCSMPGFLSLAISWSLSKFMSTALVMPSNHLTLCHHLLLLPSIFPSIRVFSNELTNLHQVVNASTSASVLPMNMQDLFHLGWTGWISLLSKGLSRLLQHHSSKASILWCSAFFIAQLSHPNMTTGKTIALTRWTFVSKVMPLHFNMLSRLVITFLPRSKHLLISWLQSPSAVILEPRKIK